MKLRTGRHNPLTLYLQLGERPSDTDPCIGLAVGPEVAATLVRLANGELLGAGLNGLHCDDERRDHLMTRLGHAARVRA